MASKSINDEDLRCDEMCERRSRERDKSKCASIFISKRRPFKCNTHTHTMLVIIAVQRSSLLLESGFNWNARHSRGVSTWINVNKRSKQLEKRDESLNIVKWFNVDLWAFRFSVHLMCGFHVDISTIADISFCCPFDWVPFEFHWKFTVPMQSCTIPSRWKKKTHERKQLHDD